MGKECTVPGCRANTAMGDFICTDCLYELLNDFSVEELYEMYYSIYSKIYIEEELHEVFRKRYGQESLEFLEKVLEDLFVYLNKVMLKRNKERS